MKKENMLFAGITALILGVTTWNVSEFLKLEKRTTTAYIAILYNLAAILRYIELVVNFVEKKKENWAIVVNSEKCVIIK